MCAAIVNQPLPVWHGQIVPSIAAGSQLDLTFFGQCPLGFPASFRSSWIHASNEKKEQFNTRLLTRKLEALGVVDAHVIVQLHDGIELLIFFSSNLILAIPGGEGVYLVKDHISLLMNDF
jgi:hypothetical protein